MRRNWQVGPPPLYKTPTGSAIFPYIYKIQKQNPTEASASIPPTTFLINVLPKKDNIFLFVDQISVFCQNNWAKAIYTLL
jgi:hypothetical protein